MEIQNRHTIGAEFRKQTDRESVSCGQILSTILLISIEALMQSAMVFLWLEYLVILGNYLEYLQTIHSFPKETQHFWSCLSFGEECIQVNLHGVIHSYKNHQDPMSGWFPDPGAPGKMDRLMLFFFRKRLYQKFKLCHEWKLRPFDHFKFHFIFMASN